MKLIDLTVRAAKGLGARVAGLEFDHNLTEDGTMQFGFGGSDLDGQDWLWNALYYLEDWPGEGPGKVHRGHFVVAHVLHTYCLRIAGDRPVEFAGHSLGGAAACYVALLFHERGHDVRKVETYGAPRIGDKAFVDSWPIPITRYVCGADPVPKIPPRPYCDLGKPTRLPSPRSWWRRYLPCGRLVDHRLHSYRLAIGQREE